MICSLALNTLVGIKGNVFSVFVMFKTLRRKLLQKIYEKVYALQYINTAVKDKETKQTNGAVKCRCTLQVNNIFANPM